MVAWGGENGDILVMDMEFLWEVIQLFQNKLVVMAVQLCKEAKNHGWVNVEMDGDFYSL